jgi:hypothetical protein
MNISRFLQLPRLLFTDRVTALLGTSLARPLSDERKSGNRNAKAHNEQDVNDPLYQKDYSNKTRMLERLGMINPNMGWPQYNRIIYPPNEDNETVKNPVNSVDLSLTPIFFKLIVYFYKFVHHMRTHIKYPAKKLWFPAFMVQSF